MQGPEQDQQRFFRNFEMKIVKYASVGIINTLVHWAVFVFLYSWVLKSQALSNLIGFNVAVVVSFFLNSKWTFRKPGSLRRFVYFSSFMALMAFSVGFASDQMRIYPLLTLVFFSGVSFLVGFLYSRFFVFR